MKKCLLLSFLASLGLIFPCRSQDKNVIPTSVVKEYVERFNQKDEELYVRLIPNSEAADFLTKNIPRFECPDKELEEIYYFRWWTYRKNIRKTPEGYVITEFLPDVGWAGKYNAISCAAALHYGEGRWLHNSEYLKAYSYYWLRGGGSVRNYVFPVAYALYNDYLVTGNDAVMKDLFPDLIKNFEAWEGDHFDAKHGLFWQIDDREGTELSIGGHGLRPVINASMIADAEAIAKIAALLGNKEQQTRFAQKAADLQKKMLETLWDKDAQFFKVLQLWEKNPQNLFQRGEPKAIPTLADVRELCGYAPWMFGLAKPEHTGAWKFLMDKKHFYAPFGPTFAEQSHPQFTISYEGHECQWNGPTWPMSTSMTLLGLANLLQTEQQKVITKKDYLDLLKVYAHSHHLTKDDGTVVPWIDENLNPFTGDWISRTRLKTWRNGTWDAGKGPVERGKDYNHSEFCDLIISGLVGLRPAEGDVLTVCPLATDKWEWFALENVLYHGKTISVIWDKTGKKYGRGKGFMVFVNGKKIATSKRLGELKVDLGFPANAQKKDELNYTDAHELMLIGQGFDNPQVDFGRLPAGMGFRQALVSLGTNSAGLALRFSTNSKTIAVKWTLRNNTIMDHMAFTGIKGLDMYKLDDKGQWSYTGTARVSGNDASHFAVVAKNLAGNMDEYIAYLPLYDGLVSLEIGVDKEAVIEIPKKKNLIKNKAVKPVVFYGTSITQGGCASRPGMAYPAILGRMLNRETINLGFSGNAILDFSVAKAIAMLDAESVVIDCLWNCTPQIVTDSAYHFISHIAKAKPRMKIFMLETLKYAEWETVYKQLVEDGYKNVIYVKSADFIGTDGEATVDGCHYTDLGFYRFANALYPFLKEFTENNN